jgi:hypothetical protein
MHQLLIEPVDDPARIRTGLRNRNGLRSRRLAGGGCGRRWDGRKWVICPPITPIGAGSNSKQTDKYYGQSASAMEAVRSSVGRQPIKHNLMNHDILLFSLRGRMDVSRYAEVSISRKGATTVIRQSKLLARQCAKSKSDLAHRPAGDPDGRVVPLRRGSASSQCMASGSCSV